MKMYIVKYQDKPIIIDAENRWVAWMKALDMNIPSPILLRY